MTLTIKIGSNVLTQANGMLDVERMQSLVAQIAALHAEGHKVILVSSGAVAAGRSMMKGYEHLEPVAQRQLLSSIGQVKLIDTYKQLFDSHNIRIGQILVTKSDFSSRQHYLNMRDCVNVLWENNVIPVVNENDTVSLTGLMFTDNDELSGMMASMSDCEKLFILSNVDGIYNGDPRTEAASVIREMQYDDNVEKYVQATKSNFGRGGMKTKCRIAQKTAASGIDVYIANGTSENIITRLVAGDQTVTCTHIAAGRRSPAVKKWIAFSDGFAKASVVVNDRARDILLDNSRAASLLAPGIVEIAGDFKKDDIVLIKDLAGNTIGVGRAAMKKANIAKQEGTHTSAVVSYDYMYIYPQKD